MSKARDLASTISAGGLLEGGLSQAEVTTALGYTPENGANKNQNNGYAGLDGSGNLGLGVTPSAWRSVWRALQFGNSGALFARTDTSYSVNIGGNIFNNASNQDIYINSSFATIYQQSSGEHRWLTAPSGTANTPISFGDAKMTLDASGRLLVGITSSQGNGSRLQISGGTQYFGSQGANAILSSTSYFNTNSIGFEIAKLDIYTGGNIYEGVFQFHTKDSGGTMAERLRITSTDILPGANGTQNLGSTSLRWSTVYTSDLSLNNGIGDWTIVEGEDDLFIYNNRSNKVYKFKLEEVDPALATPKRG